MSSGNQDVAVQPAAAPINNPNGGQQQQQQRPQSTWQMFQSIATRMLIFYFAMQAINYFKAKPNTQQPIPTSGGGGGGSGADGTASSMAPGNMFPAGTRFDLYVYISELDKFEAFDDEKALFWMIPDVEYGNWNIGPNADGQLFYNGQIPLTSTMQNNGTIYMHVYVTENGRSPNPNDKETYSKRRTFSTFKRLNKYSKRIYKTTKNLLTGSTDKDEEYQSKAKENVVEIVSHWHPNMTINLVDDHTPWQPNGVPPPLNEFIEFDKVSGKYYPVIYLNDYWNLNAHYYPINSSLSYLNLSLTFSHLQLWKWQLYLSQGMKNQWYGGMFQDDSSDEDQDTIKKTLLDTNPYLLVLTVIITLVHNVFEFLAFKNDIQFWRNKKSLEGLSVNSVLFGCVTSLIVLLYVLDNDTNTIVRISVGIGLLIDLWKVPKVVHVSVDYENKLLGVVPRVKFVHKTSYVKSQTNEFDRLAFKYLSWILFPLVVGYAVYSLIYLEHKGWYSWVLSMIYGFLLTFGFIMMTPQLFINYKLKSVAHLPWRMMTYKALNTFIDDIFAFVIQMPTMYRIGCFRDDIIFFIYLYQKWIYPVDKKRTNEFGTTGDGSPPVDDDDQATAAATAVATTAITNEAHPKSE